MALSLSWDIRPGKRGWAVPLDVWMLVNGAEYVAAGALGYMYEARVGPALPLFHILLAPAAYIGYELGLTKSDPRFIAYPTMWLLVGPYAMSTAIPVLAWTRRLGQTLTGAAGLAHLQLAIAIVGIGPAFFYGHFEDGLALGLLLLALALRLSGRPDGAALALALAVASKQWALLALPVVALAYLPRFRARQWLLALSVPALLAGFVLAVDWSHAAPALFDAPTYPELGHTALWARSGSRVIVTTPFRLLLLATPFAVALWLRRAPSEQVLLDGAALVLWARVLLEPVLHSYYLAPGLALLTVAAFRRKPHSPVWSTWPTAALGFAMVMLFALHPREWLWWSIFYAGCVVMAMPCLLGLLRRDGYFGQEGRNSDVGGLEPHGDCS